MASPKKKPTIRKKPATARATTSSGKSEAISHRSKFTLPSWRRVGKTLVWPFVTVYKKLRHNREVSPHKSFTRTRKRDKLKQPKIEGYIAFPWYVLRILWNRKWLYTKLVLAFFILSIIFIGTMQASNLTSVNDAIDSAGSGNSVIGPVMRAAVTVGSSLSGALNNNLTDVQYLYISALYILVLLTVVWLLRHQLAGNKVKVRDGLYNAASPIASEYALIIIGITQLIPAALGTLVYVSAMTSGLLDGGIESAMFSIALVLIIVLTLYFMTTTLFAMFIATIPGTYPMKAYHAARKIVAGQRLRLLIRLLWMAVIIFISWFIVLVPVVIIANSLGEGSSMMTPIAIQIMTIASFVYGTAYGYLLYRRMIDDPVVEK
jgi:hypothetical protein